MARTRLAVALLVPDPYRDEVDGLRRALGGDLRRIPPHITVVPPVNVNDERIGEAMALVRRAAGELAGPLVLDVGPGATFMPVNRVVYLAVEGVEAQLGALDRLRAGTNDGVITREDHRAFVPHVTISNRVDADDVPAALRTLAGYRVEMTFPRVDLLAFDADGRRWTSIADVPLGPRRVVGRGGIEVEITASSRLDPEALSFVDRAAPVAEGPIDIGGQRLVLVARAEESVVGVATGRLGGIAAWLDGLVVDPDSRRTGVGSHLLAAFADEAVRQGASRIATASPDDHATRELLAARGWEESPAGSLLVAGDARPRRRWRRGARST